MDSLKEADYLLDEKLMTSRFRCGYRMEYAKLLLIQKIAEIFKNFLCPKCAHVWVKMGETQ
jgi:hypothetical protein